MRSTYDAQEDFLERQFFFRGLNAILRSSGRLRFDSGAQLLEESLGYQASLMDDGDVAAQAFDDLENMGSEKDGRAAGDHALQHRLQRAGSDGVHAFEGLVEEENLRAMDHSCGHGELLLHSVRVVRDKLFGLVGELHELEQLDGALGGGLAIKTVHASGIAQEFSSGQAAEQSHSFGNDADLALHLDRIRIEIDTQNLDPPGSGGE